MNPKYHNSYFWENLVSNRNLVDTFNNEQIQDNSVFFHGIIYNNFGRRKLLEDVLHFSSLDALTGYLHYVFLPTAFLSFTNDSKGITVPMGLSLPELVGYVSNNDFVRFHGYLQPMITLLDLSEECTRTKPEELDPLLKRMETIFNYEFQIDRDAYAMMHIYRSPEELGEYFSNLYQITGGKQLGSELFYHKTGLHRGAWENLYKNAGENIFTSRKFMNCVKNLLHTM